MQMDIETTLAPSVEPTGPDWDRIRADYEAGAPSIREIAAREGVSDTAIHKRARANGWDTGLRKGLHDPPANQVQTKPAVERIIEAIKTTKQAEEEDDPWQPDNPDILIWERPSIVVYLNKFDMIVIREDSRDGPDRDPFVRIHLHDVPRLIKRLQELAR
jgi:hypothetical protein